MSIERLHTVKEVRETLKVGKLFAYKLVQSGEIRAVHVERCLRVRATDLEKYFAALLRSARGNVRGSPESLATRGEPQKCRMGMGFDSSGLSKIRSSRVPSSLRRGISKVLRRWSPTTRFADLRHWNRSRRIGD